MIFAAGVLLITVFVFGFQVGAHVEYRHQREMRRLNRELEDLRRG